MSKASKASKARKFRLQKKRLDKNRKHKKCPVCGKVQDIHIRNENTYWIVTYLVCGHMTTNK